MTSRRSGDAANGTTRVEPQLAWPAAKRSLDPFEMLFYVANDNAVQVRRRQQLDLGTHSPEDVLVHATTVRPLDWNEINARGCYSEGGGNALLNPKA
jgi:hypothetical protein